VARFVIDEVIGGQRQGLGRSLAEAVDQVGRGVGPGIGFGAAVPRVVGEAVIAERRGVAGRVAVGVVGEAFRIGEPGRPMAADAEQATKRRYVTLTFEPSGHDEQGADRLHHGVDVFTVPFHEVVFARRNALLRRRRGTIGMPKKSESLQQSTRPEFRESRPRDRNSRKANSLLQPKAQPS